MELNNIILKFRVASRELFNQFFRVDNPYDDDNAWILQERHKQVQALLFEKLVLEPADLPYIEYGFTNPFIHVTPSGSACPAMLNREIDSGYWDYPLGEISSDVTLTFRSFFDWDQLGYKDHLYVHVVITEWASHPELIGKHALIETHYVQFEKSTETTP